MTLRTVTLSPGFDHLVRIDDAEPGEVGRVLAWEVVAAGKGINAARVAALLGVDCVAYTLVGEADEHEFRRHCASSNVPVVTFPVPGETRRNLTLTVGQGAALASHAVGPRLAGAADVHADGLIRQLVSDVEPGDIVTFNGAVAGSVRQDVWAEAATVLQARGASVVADVQGEPLLSLVRTGIPVMVKPNEHEALALAPGAAGVAPDDAAWAAVIERMEHFGVTDAMVTIGSRGIIHREDAVVMRSWCPVDDPSVTVGAGDAFLAGYCAALTTREWNDWRPIELGLACAAAHVSGSQGTGFRATVDGFRSEIHHERLTS